MQMMQLKVLFKVKRRGNNNKNNPGKAEKQWKSCLICSSGRFFPLHQTNQIEDWVFNVQSMQRIILPYFPNTLHLSLFLSLSLLFSIILLLFVLPSLFAYDLSAFPSLSRFQFLATSC